MIVIYLLIPLSILIAVGFLAAFIWAVRSGQYEDTHTPSLRMLWEDRGPRGKAAPTLPPASANSGAEQRMSTLGQPLHGAAEAKDPSLSA